MKKTKISVIVPVYNVEKYLKRCLDSLWSQTYPNIEYIFVEDCSTDSSKKILLKEIKNKNNVILIENKKNKGLSYSRNIALEKATGDYIGYIDSDDYIESNYYESLMNSALENNSDIVVCGLKTIQGKKITTNICGGSKKKDYVNHGLAASACNKIFKKNIIKKYPFEVGKTNEDIGTVLPLLINSQNVNYNKEVYYYYFQRSNSIQNREITNKRFDIFEEVDLALSRISDKDDLDAYQDIIVFQQLISFLLYAISFEPDNKKRRNLLKKFHNLSKKYNISENSQLRNFYNTLGKPLKTYYQCLIFLGEHKLYTLESLLIQIYHRYKNRKRKTVIKEKIELKDLIEVAKNQNTLEKKVTISVVIPNYNYEDYLYQRIYSVLNQTVKIDELIILDDCSTDSSREKIDEIVEYLNPYIRIQKIYNTKNSNNPFKQWKKGMDLARGNYVWIAEADDYCDNKFLEAVTKPLLIDKNILISYCDTSFINSKGNIILKTVKKQIDCQNTGHWNKNYITLGKEEFEKYAYLNCTIANVSSAVIKKSHYDSLFEKSIEFRQAGDWVFYAGLMNQSKCKIAYCNRRLNYYRVHDNNVSTITNKVDHMNEIIRIHNYYKEKFGLNKKQLKMIEERYKFLRQAWKLEQ